MEKGDNEDDFDEGTNGDSENKGKGGKEEDNEGYLIAVDGEQDIGSKSQFNLAEQLQGREETVTYGCDGRLNKSYMGDSGSDHSKVAGSLSNQISAIIFISDPKGHAKRASATFQARPIQEDPENMPALNALVYLPVGEGESCLSKA